MTRLSVRSFSSSFFPLPLASVRVNGSHSSRPPVLFLHGLFGSKNNWRSVARQVSATTGRNCFCVDLRNHGDSPHSDAASSVTLAMAQDVKHFLQKENINRSVIVGHSLGGRVALQFAHLNVSVSIRSPTKSTKLQFKP